MTQADRTLSVKATHLVQELLSNGRLELVQHMPEVVQLLSFMLVKDAAQRPAVAAVSAK